MAGPGLPATDTRSALIVASGEYADPALRRLRAPSSDAHALADVLSDPDIGGFEVRTLFNEPAHVANLAIEEFFVNRAPADLLLVHFSCHGIKDEDGQLYFAAHDTVMSLLGATAVAAEFVGRCMNRSRSRRVVLLLDCCYAGAFERGLVARAGVDMGIGEQLGGRGRAVITASSAMEYAFEAGELTDDTQPPPSVFTGALVEGLQTGDADQDLDGLVGLDELYDYVYERVRARTPHQTPGKWTFGVEGELVIARRGRPVTTASPLPPELQHAMESPFAGVRAGVIRELETALRGSHPGLALAARLALEQLANDDSRFVAAAAATALQQSPAVPVTATTAPGAHEAAPLTSADALWPPAPGSGPAARQRRRRNALVGGGTAAAAACLAVGLIFGLKSPAPKPAPPPVHAHIRWIYHIPGASSAINTGPAIADGTVYISTDGGSVYALKATTGRRLWTRTIGSPILSSPAVADGMVYVGSDNDKVYALNAATGRVRWSHPTGDLVTSSPAVAAGIVYVGSHDDKVYALSAATGRVRWSYKTGGAVESSPAVADGTVCIGSDDGKLYAFDARTGQLRWARPTGAPIWSSPAAADGTVIFGSTDGTAYALAASTGHVIWKDGNIGADYSSPVVVGDTVYIADSEGAAVYALNVTNGGVEWIGRPSGADKAGGSPAVAGSTVYITDDNGKIYALNARDGKILWSYTIGSLDVITGRARPVVAGDTVYIGGAGAVYALSAKP
jgi:outer membrane protein assembly factor BamB